MKIFNARTFSPYLRLENNILSQSQSVVKDLNHQIANTKTLLEFQRECTEIHGEFQRFQEKMSAKFQAKINNDPAADFPTIAIPADVAKKAALFFKTYGIQIGDHSGLNALQTDPIFDPITGWQIKLSTLTYAQCTAIVGVLDKFSKALDSKTSVGETQRSNFLDSKNALQTDLTQFYVNVFRLKISLLSGFKT